MIDRREESYTVTVYQTYKVTVSAFDQEEASQQAEVAVGANPELYLLGIDYNVERD